MSRCFLSSNVLGSNFSDINNPFTKRSLTYSHDSHAIKFLHFVIISRVKISSHIITLLNYRTAVPPRSDFSGISRFPEVYHGQGTSKAAISAAVRLVTGQGWNTTYSVFISWIHRYILCFRAAGRRCMERRSGTSFFRIWPGKERIQHRFNISICRASA